MKTTILASVAAIALMTAGAAAAAGNSSTVNQSGTGQSATVDQSLGDNGLSTIDQTGSGQTASVTQGVLPGANHNTSDVDQAGSGNAATVSQDGTWNSSDVDQANNDNKAFVTQVGTGLALGDVNEAVVNQLGSAEATSTIGQTGYGNFASTVQGATGAMATTLITGDGNTSYIRQNTGAALGDTPNNVASLTVTGDNNYSEIFQGEGDPSAHDNTATVEQAANGGASYVYQNGVNGLVEVTQTTDGATSTVSQLAGSSNAQAFVTQ